MTDMRQDTTPQLVARAFDPGRLAQARRMARLNKTELQRQVGVSASALGQYERGEVTPRPETIAELARALGVPVGFFAYGRPRVQLDVTQASFRRLRATSVGQQQQAIAFVEQVWELSAYLEELVEFPEIDLPAWAWADDGVSRAPDPITAARLIRQQWDLGDDPIKFFAYELERHGVLTVLFSLREDPSVPEASRIDAFSTAALPRPVVVLTPDKADDVLRHRFSAAHELGHIVLHAGTHATGVAAEREADAFAAELLMPRARMLDELPRRLNIARLEELSQRWGASTKALVFRSKELELISEATARRAYVTLSSLAAAGALRAQSIWHYPGEQPELLKNALELLVEAGTSVEQVARDLQMTPRHVRRLAGLLSQPPRLTLVRED
jgi:Zn-dependent peptidase ImmA (M78 family)